jgi:hypothetical protein
MQEVSTTVGETMQILGREWRCICGTIARETWQPADHDKAPSSQGKEVKP